MCVLSFSLSPPSWVCVLLVFLRVHVFSLAVCLSSLQMGVVLNNSQIANINKMRSTLRDLERWEALYRHRPKHSIKDGPKAWWVFLVKCLSKPGKADKRAKLGWLDVARLLALRKRYVRLYTARARHQATPEEYKQFKLLDERLTANEIVAFRLKAIAELEEEEAALNLALSDPQQQQAQPPRQTWGEWLLRRGPTSAGNTDGDAVDRTATGTAPAPAAPGEDAAAQAEFLRAFSSDMAGEGDKEGGDQSRNRRVVYGRVRSDSEGHRSS